MGKSSFMRRRGADPTSKADAKSGYNLDTGPYEAEVIGWVPGTRQGQMRVWVPDWGGLKTDPNSQATVSYVSPFYGVTYGTDTQTAPPGAYTSGQSYGMWMVPPDIGNIVVVMFIAGDRNRGIYIGSKYDGPSHSMVPALGRNIGGESNSLIDPALPSNVTGPLYNNQSIGANSAMPTVEYDTGLPTAFTDLVNTQRYIHPYQASVLINQGLDRDLVRGAISSSSMRESPSNVYGISTPGRSITGNINQNINDPSVQSADAVYARIGGHSFVMDDGATGDPATGTNVGVDQLIRLKTSGGHQILMNDTQNILYIASASGAHWVEFSNDGTINVYGRNGINIRTEGVLNLQGDQGVFINSGGGSQGGGTVSINGDNAVSITSTIGISLNAFADVSIKAAGAVSLGAGGIASLTAGGLLNLGSAGITNISGSMTNLTGKPGLGGGIPSSAQTVNLPDVTWNGQQWVLQSGSLKTICLNAPAHEPWIDPKTGNRPTLTTPTNNIGTIATGFAVGAAASAGAAAGVGLGSSAASALGF
jgi:hypothetical protein